ncbi:MAG: T9SS type A sorting domain-containing protein, partial [Bacteroidetes bacterium]|nr:T9SS type A sorting domain-containing protein [Bacteroidota bacterium]
IYYDSLQATAGCDSIVITDLTVNLIYEETIDVALCDGESYTLANSNVVTDSGTYIVTLQTVLGCDSTITVILTVDPVFLTHLDTAVCLGDSVFAGDAWQLSSGQYYDTLLAVTGCDSIIETDLLILLPQTTTIDVIICNGDSVYAGGAWQDTTGTYSDLYTSMLGCDSTVVTNLSVTDTLMTIVSEGICDLDSIFLEGAWQNMAGVYTDNFVAQAGCDSTVITTLTVTTSVNAGINSLDTVCNNVTMVNLISKLDGNPDLGGTWSDDDTTGALNMGLFYPPQVTSYQEYHFTYTVSGTSPCGDSSAVLTIFVDNCTEVAEKQAVEVVVYPSVSDGEFSIGIKGANGGVVPVKVIDVTGKVVYSDQLESVSGSSTSKINLTHLSEGMYFIEFQVNGQRNTYRLVIL